MLIIGTRLERNCSSLLPFRTYRYAAYRQFSWLIYTKLGRHNRRILPACAILKIRETFPDHEGSCGLFVGDDEGADGLTTEITEAWEFVGGFD